MTILYSHCESIKTPTPTPQTIHRPHKIQLLICWQRTCKSYNNKTNISHLSNSKMTRTPTKNFDDTPTKSNLEGKRILICHFRRLPTYVRAIFWRHLYVKYSMSVVSIPLLHHYSMTSTNHLEPLSDSIISHSPLAERERSRWKAPRYKRRRRDSS